MTFAILVWRRSRPCSSDSRIARRTNVPGTITSGGGRRLITTPRALRLGAGIGQPRRAQLLEGHARREQRAHEEAAERARAGVGDKALAARHQRGRHRAIERRGREEKASIERAELLEARGHEPREDLRHRARAERAAGRGNPALHHHAAGRRELLRDELDRERVAGGPGSTWARAAHRALRAPRKARAPTAPLLAAERAHAHRGAEGPVGAVAPRGGRHEQHARSREAAQHDREHLPRGVVEPVQILDRDHEGRVLGEHPQRASQRDCQLDAAWAARTLVARDRIGQPEQLAEQTDLARLEVQDAQPLDLREALGRGILGLDTAEVRHEIGDHVVRALGRALVPARTDEREASRARERAELVGQTRLADTGLADDRERLELAALHAVEDGAEALCLLAASDERGAAHVVAELVAARTEAEQRAPIGRETERGLEVGSRLGAEADLARLGAADEGATRLDQRQVRLEQHALGDAPVPFEHRDGGGWLGAAEALLGGEASELERRPRRVGDRTLGARAVTEGRHPHAVEGAEDGAAADLARARERDVLVVALVGDEQRDEALLHPDPPRGGDGSRSLPVVARVLARGEHGAGLRDGLGVVERAPHHVDAQLVRRERVLGREHPVERRRELDLSDRLASTEEELGDLARELAAPAEPLVARGGERALEHVADLGADLERLGGDVGDLGLAHERERLLRGAATEHAPSRDELVEHDAEREEVAAPVERLAARLLGRHVRVLAAQDRRVFASAQAALVGARDAEVGELHVALVAEEDVLGRDVAMDDLHRAAVVAPAAMRVIERLGGLSDDPEAQREREALGASSAPRHRLAEVLAVHVLHRDEVRPPLLAELEDLDDARMGEARRDLGLAHEEIGEARLRHQRRQDALDDDRLLEAGGAARARAPHLGHPALGDPIQQLVIAEDDRSGHAGTVSGSVSALHARIRGARVR